MSDALEVRNRRWSTLVWGAIPVALLAGALVIDHIPGTSIRLTVPYAAEGPGPVFDTLGDASGEPVVDIEGTPTLETGGQLNMTTVSVRTNMTLGQAIGRWVATDDTIVPIEQIMPPDSNEEQTREMNQQAFVASEASATVAAMHYLNRPTTVAVHDVVDGSASDGVLRAGDRIVKVGEADVDTQTMRNRPTHAADLARGASRGSRRPGLPLHPRCYAGHAVRRPPG